MDDLFDDNDPMSWREFLDLHASLPLWVRILSQIRLRLGL